MAILAPPAFPTHSITCRDRLYPSTLALAMHSLGYRYGIFFVGELGGPHRSFLKSIFVPLLVRGIRIAV